MKNFDAQIAAHLAGGRTTLAWCWRLTRRDGIGLGFTDHDRDLVFDGTTFEASAGFTASEMRDSIGLSVSNLEVESALSSTRLDETDILTGRYDDARVEIWRVNWQAPDQRVLMRAGSIGEVRRSGLAFSAEVRGLSHYLQQPSGRLFQYGCDADLGDVRCKVSLETSAFRSLGTVSSVTSPRSFSATGLHDYLNGWFNRGMLTFSSGINAGRGLEIKRHSAGAGQVDLELWQKPATDIEVGDVFVVTAGCDKHLATCASKFTNQINFRGFPHMPGNDFLSSVARAGQLPSTGA